MDERNPDNQSYTEPLLELSNGDEASYEDLLGYLSAKRKLFLSQPKGKKLPTENTLFLQACSKLYNVGPKLFSESNYGLLRRHPKFAEDIVGSLRPAMLKTLFGNYTDLEAVVENRIYILAVLYKNGIIQKIEGQIHDQDWIRFLNAINPEKLEQYANVFAQIEPLTITNTNIFSQLKAHNDLENLPTTLGASLLLNQSYGNKDTLPHDIFTEESQIKGFTLINEYICKRTRFFPKQWKAAMKLAWEDPSLEASFELYKVYSERQIWLSKFIGFPIIYRFLNYFYNKPIFQTFDEEPLTRACKILQSADELTKDNFAIIADMSELKLSFCAILLSKGKLKTDYLKIINEIPEKILQNIYNSNEAQRMIPSTFDALIKLGQTGIDGTKWMSHKPNWRIISTLSNKTLEILGSLDLDEHIFEQIKYLHDRNAMQTFDRLNESQQKNLLTNTQNEKILTLLQHLEKISLFTPENIQFIFDNQRLFIEDQQLVNTFLRLEKSSATRDQKRLNRFMQSLDRSASPRSRSPSQSRDLIPVNILSTLPDEQIAVVLSQKLQTLGIVIKAEDLDLYSPTVLQAFHAVLPLFKEENLLTQTNLKSLLRFFSAAPDPRIRSRCMIVLAQCGLLAPDKISNKVGKLELLYQENPDLFREIYAEAWVQTETSTKWLEDIISAGLQESDISANAEETLIRRFLIENEENSAYLSLDDTKQSVAGHVHAPLLQQVLKLLDKSKINIESILDGLLQTNEEQIQKVYAWLYILDKAELLDSSNAKQIIKHCHALPAEVDFLKTTVAAIKAHPELKMNTALKQKSWDQLLSSQTTASNKQKILDYMALSINNPTAAAKIAFMVSDAADVAGEKAVIVQDQLMRTAGSLAASATDMGQKVFDKMRLFSSKPAASPKPKVPEFVIIATRCEQFNGSFYQEHPKHLQADLGALLYQDLLSEANVQWLMEQPNQMLIGRCLRLLAKANLLKDDNQWKNKINLLVATNEQEFTKVEKKCQAVLKSQEPQQVKERTMQMWLEPLVGSPGHSPKGTRKH